MCLNLAVGLYQYRVGKVLYSEDNECKEAKPESCLMLVDVRIHCMSLHSGLCKDDVAKGNLHSCVTTVDEVVVCTSSC